MVLRFCPCGSLSVPVPIYLPCTYFKETFPVYQFYPKKSSYWVSFTPMFDSRSCFFISTACALHQILNSNKTPFFSKFFLLLALSPPPPLTMHLRGNFHVNDVTVEIQAGQSIWKTIKFTSHVSIRWRSWLCNLWLRIHDRTITMVLDPGRENQTLYDSLIFFDDILVLGCITRIKLRPSTWFSSSPWMTEYSAVRCPLLVKALSIRPQKRLLLSSIMTERGFEFWVLKQCFFKAYLSFIKRSNSSKDLFISGYVLNFKCHTLELIVPVQGNYLRYAVLMVAIPLAHHLGLWKPPNL